MDAVIRILFFVCPWLALFFFVRLACAPFNAKIAGQIRRHPIQHTIWGCFALVGVGFYVWLMNPGIFYSASKVRQGQRERVLTRVQEGGGWEALKKDCEELIKQHPNEPFYWSHGKTNGLPPALAVLTPQQIRFYPPPKEPSEGAAQPRVVQIKVFGMHSTGGISTPYYGLEIVSGAGAESYRPQPSSGGVSGNRYRTYRAITNGVYEIY